MRAALPLIASATIIAAGLVIAGPLNPPVGPVASSYKTLSDVEPRTGVSVANTPGDAGSQFKITQPGSYYLTADVPPVAGLAGVTIAADHVTLDLNGFNIAGGSQGILVSAPPNGTRTDIAIRHGSITGCAANGVSAAAADGAVIEDVQVRSCGSAGITAGS